MEDDNEPRRRDDIIDQLTKQPLDPLSVSELDDRIAVLEGEIARVKAHKAAATSHKALAESFFKKK